ncbi:hypothetical protein [Micromonospora sp. NPDC049107]|uniref:hypothetical protein n=1 Tax=unclassified Micromonospora TaxID=2617518 RepID=UPI0033EDF7D2
MNDTYNSGGSVGFTTTPVRSFWLTWPAGIIAAISWALGHFTRVATFDLAFVAGLSWMLGVLLSDGASRYLVAGDERPRGDTDPQPETEQSP